MRSLLVGIAVIAGCGFHPTELRDAPGSAAPDTSAGTAADAMPDAAFDPLTCLAAGYAPLPGQTSYYRMLTGAGSAWVHSDDCNDDLPGATHLAVLDDLPETMAVQILVSATPALSNSGAFYGGVQEPGQTSPGSGWISFADTPMFTAWSSGEPDDGGSHQETGKEQFVGLAYNRAYDIDYPGNATNGAICECDGHAIGSAAAALLAMYQQQ